MKTHRILVCCAAAVLTWLSLGLLPAAPTVKFKDAAGATVACFHDDGSVMLKGSMEKSDFSSVPTSNITVFKDGSTTRFYIDQSDQSTAKFPATLYLPPATFSIAGSGNSVIIPAHDFKITTTGSYGLAVNSATEVLQGFKGDLGTAGSVYGLRTKYIVYENRDDVEHLPDPLCQAYTPTNMTDLVYALWRLKHNQNRGNRPYKTMVIAFMGGSMTQGEAPSSWENWYPYQIAEYLLATLWPGSDHDGWKYLIVNAASNGHTSPLGACYSDDRVLRDGRLYTYSTSVNKDYAGTYDKFAENPDLVIVEYSGNDHLDYEVEYRTWDTWKIQQRAYEGLLRRLLYVSGDENARKIARPGVICFSVMVPNGQISYNGEPSLANRVYTPATGWARTMQEKHLRIAKNYAAPLVSLRDHTWRRQLEFSYDPAATRPPNDVWTLDYTFRSAFLADCTHPNDAGNGVMKEVVQSILSTAIGLVPALGSPPTAPAALPPRICYWLPNFEYYTSFIEGKINAYAPGSPWVTLGGWTAGTTTVYVPRGIDSTNKGNPGTLGLGPVYNVPCWKADSPSDELTVTIPAGTKEIFAQHSVQYVATSDITVEVWIDGQLSRICLLNARVTNAQSPKTLKWLAISWNVEETGSARTLKFKSFSGPDGTAFELHKVFATGKL